jgi:hypothetical protein
MPIRTERSSVEDARLTVGTISKAARTARSASSSDVLLENS